MLRIICEGTTFSYQLEVVHVCVPIEVANDGAFVLLGDVEIESSILPPVVLIPWGDVPYQEHLRQHTWRTRRMGNYSDY